MNHLIAISGLARTGKDSIANHLVSRRGFVKLPFADPLKFAVQAMFGLTDEQMDDSQKEVVVPYWGISLRKMLQLTGTEAVKPVFGEDFWVRRWAKDYAGLFGHSSVVIPDVRFQVEADYLRAIGGTVIHLSSNRGTPLSKEAQAHRSEAGILRAPGDYDLQNNDTLEDLHQALREIMDDIEARHGQVQRPH